MTKKFLIAIPFCLLGFHGTSQVTAQGTCEEQRPPDQCQAASSLTINTQSRNISPPNICMSPGQNIAVNVVPEGSASIVGKGGGWPIGNGTSFSITAPAAAGNYDYNVTFDDGTCIDPRVTVK
jgi:hypothetical protein